MYSCKCCLSLSPPAPSSLAHLKSHEFTDEHSYSEFCLTEPLGYRTSRSTSLSSQQGSKSGLSTSCCPRRAKRRTTRLTNSTMTMSRASAQELDTLNSQKSAAPQR